MTIFTFDALSLSGTTITDLFLNLFFLLNLFCCILHDSLSYKLVLSCNVFMQKSYFFLQVLNIFPLTDLIPCFPIKGKCLLNLLTSSPFLFTYYLFMYLHWLAVISAKISDLMVQLSVQWHCLLFYKAMSCIWVQAQD